MLFAALGPMNRCLDFVAMGELYAAEVEHAIAEILVASFLLPDDLKQA